jgi:hypothetical protein
MREISIMFCKSIDGLFELEGMSDSEFRDHQVLLKEKFDNFLSSTIWRLTKPVRLLIAWVSAGLR